MKRLQTKVMNTPVGFSDTSGIARAGQIYTKSMQGGLAIADEIFGFAEKNLTVQRKQEAAADAAVVDFHTDPVTGMPEIPETPHTWTIYGDEYQKQVVNRYANRIENDLATTITQKAVEFPTDPTGFQEWVGEYIKETALQTDPRARGAVEAYGRDIARRALGGIVSRKATLEREGAVLEETASLSREHTSLMATAGTDSWDDAYNRYKAKLANSPNAFFTEGHREKELTRVRKSASLSASIRGLVGLQGYFTHDLESDKKTETTAEVQRTQAIADLPNRKGDLYTKFVEKMGLSDSDLVELQGVLNSQLTKLNAAESALLDAMEAKSATESFHFFTNIYGKNKLEQMGITEELIEHSPAKARAILLSSARAVIAMENHKRTNETRDRVDGETKEFINWSLSHTKERSKELPPSLKRQFDEEVRVIESTPMGLKNQAKAVTKVFNNLVSSAVGYKRKAEEEIPFARAFNKFQEDGSVTRMRNTQKTAKIAERHYRSTIAGNDWGDNGYDHQLVRDNAITYIEITGVVPQGFGEYIASLAGSDTPEDVGQAQRVLKQITERTGVLLGAISSSLGTSGATIIGALKRFEDEGGLTAGGDGAVAAWENYRSTLRGSVIDFEKATREAIHPTDRSEQDKVLSETFVSRLGAKFDPGFLKKLTPIFMSNKSITDSIRAKRMPQAGHQFRRDVMKRFYAFANTIRDGSYNQAMDNAIESVIADDNYGVSIAGGRPHGISDTAHSLYFVKHAPENRLADPNNDSELGLKDLAKKINDHYQNSPAYASVKNKEELVFGKNLYVQWVKDSPSGHPIYTAVLISEQMDRFVVNYNADQKLETTLFDTSDIVNNQTKRFMKKQQAKREEQEKLRKELEARKDKRGRN